MYSIFRLNNFLEFDCFVRALTYQASHMPRSEMFDEADPEGVKEAKAMAFAW